jgi:retron-type reverse transcriptase
LILARIEAESRERERERGNAATFIHTYDDIISIKNLLTAWREFLNGKRKRRDIEKFSLHLTDNILELNRELHNKTYRHGPYKAFRINDPKARDIHKASVRDRLLHHAIYRILYPYFDSKFIFDSYSCRRGKGTHRAINRFREYGRIVSKNHTKTVWVLKCDIRKFFANIDHQILLNIFNRQVKDKNTVWLLCQIIESFHTKDKPGIGLPLGNLTSQLLVNIYMNEFDQFTKRELKVKHYIRYADDFVFFHEDKKYLENLLIKISEFLNKKLKLALHPDKVFIKTLASGVDFLGWVHFSLHRIPRTSTKNRIFRKLKNNPKKESIKSYQGYLIHGNTYKLLKKIPCLGLEPKISFKI